MVASALVNSSEPVGRDDVPLTFGCLRKEAGRLALAGGVSPATLAADASALNSFMRSFSVSDVDPFMGILALSPSGLNEKLREHEASSGLAPESVGSYRSRIRAWNDLGVAMADAQPVKPDGMLSLVVGSALSAYLENHPGTDIGMVADAVGMNRRWLFQWRHSAPKAPVATIHNIEVAGRLEDLFSLPRGRLSSLLGVAFRGRHRNGKPHKQVVADRKVRNADEIFFSHIRLAPIPFPPAIEAFCEKYSAFKTTAKNLYNQGGSQLVRPGSVWRLSPKSDDPNPSETLFRSRVGIFMGWLMLPTTEEGARKYVVENCNWKKKVLSREDAKKLAPFFVGKGLELAGLTPAHLADPDLISEFIDWRKNRNGSADEDYLTDVMALLAPGRGFLTQQVEFAWHYPKLRSSLDGKLRITPVDPDAPDPSADYEARSVLWRSTCRRWRGQAVELLQFVERGRSKSARDKLLPILKHPDPMSVITTIIGSHAADVPAARLEVGYPASKWLAIWVRDQLIMRMLASNPLRNRNFREMRHRKVPSASDRGNLYQTPEGAWRLRYEPHELKNEAGAAKDLYDVGVPSDIWPLIELYLLKARPLLLAEGGDTDRVFLSRFGKPFTGSTMTMAVVSLTARYTADFPELLGFGTHAFRHIVATAWLRSHPKDYLTVAHILHDKLETVLENYGHDTPDDGLKFYNAWLATKLQPFSAGAL